MNGNALPLELNAGETIFSLRKRIAAKLGPGVHSKAVILVLQGAELQDEQEVTVGDENDVVSAIINHTMMAQCIDDLVQSASTMMSAQVKDLEEGFVDNNGSYIHHEIGAVGKAHVDVEAGEVRVQFELLSYYDQEGYDSFFKELVYEHDVGFSGHSRLKCNLVFEFCRSGTRSVSEALRQKGSELASRL